MGLELSTVGLVVYFALLLLWSMCLAYLFVFGLAPRIHKEMGAHGSSHGGGGSHGDSHGKNAGHGHAAPVEVTRAKPFRGFSPYEGFKSYAQGDTVTIEDIVKGIARESGAAVMHTAHEAVDHAPHLHKPEVASVVEVNAFLSALVARDREAAFETLRNIEEHGEGAEPFLRRVLGAVESALNARLHGTTCDVNITNILGSCDTDVMQKLADALVASDGKTGSKLAITRALNALK